MAMAHRCGIYILNATLIFLETQKTLLGRLINGMLGNVSNVVDLLSCESRWRNRRN